LTEIINFENEIAKYAEHKVCKNHKLRKEKFVNK